MAYTLTEDLLTLLGKTDIQAVQHMRSSVAMYPGAHTPFHARRDMSQGNLTPSFGNL